jgi:ComF family protein
MNFSKIENLKIGNFAKDCLFPIFCFGCGGEGSWVCNDCWMALDDRGVFLSETGAIASFAAAVSYRERGLVRTLVHALKYQYATELLFVFQRLLRGFFALHAERFRDADAIVPVPLHPRRFAERGFNQAELIGGIAAGELGKPIVHMLRRARYTRCQAQLAKEERGKNVQGAFALRAETDVAGKRVLLVDDVYTTGATMQECARLLRAAGAVSVSGFAVAHG